MRRSEGGRHRTRAIQPRPRWAVLHDGGNKSRIAQRHTPSAHVGTTPSSHPNGPVHTSEVLGRPARAESMPSASPVRSSTALAAGPGEEEWEEDERLWCTTRLPDRTTKSRWSRSPFRHNSCPQLASGPRGRSDRHILAGGESHRCDRTDSTGTGTCPAANVSTQQLPTMAEMSSLLRSAHKGIPRRKRWKARPGSDEGFAGATRLPRRVAAAASRSAGRASSRPGCVQSGSATVSAQTRV